MLKSKIFNIPASPAGRPSNSSPAFTPSDDGADNDQMPIVRMAVDWGDGSDPYVVKGWFKNRKPWCDGTGWKVCGADLNRPCQNNDDCGGGSCAVPAPPKDRLHFGNSFDACQQGYYQFTHLYTCPGKATAEVPACSAARTTNCWDGANKKCLFKPKVQVLDNWGWCNGDCEGAGKGCWNDAVDPNGKLLVDDQRACYTGKTEPWTSFAGTIEVEP